jgi:predicted nuclease of predicted toxin-antitoxin system
LLRKSYRTQLIATEDKDGTEKAARAGECGFLKPHIFTLTIPQVNNYLIEQTLKFLLHVSTLNYYYFFISVSTLNH